ncbi:MAG: 2-succinyl-5-enolpyruvyl-6-hydroxy-3-cyclohexene-1-carboxylic-acid synthase [Elainellaceae cyanobacterium]
MLDFRTTNSLWSSVMAEVLARLGVETAVLCPGSRSTPLTVAFAQHPAIQAIPMLDERSAAFFALGRSRQTRQPTVLVCTSGTAGANFYPAVIEAQAGRVPLLIITSDRPPELRDCNAGQTIDQQKLYGSYPNWYSELAIPSTEPALLAYLRQTLIYAWERSRYPVAGPVHLNQPFRDPLAPIPQADVLALAKQWDEPQFFAAITRGTSSPTPTLAPEAIADHVATWGSCDRGVIIAGVDQPDQPRAYCRAIAYLAKTLGFPVLAEGLSPVRNHADCNPYLVATYDGILRHPARAAALAPEVVIRIGEMPTSKVLRQWLDKTQPLQWVIDGGDRNLDPTHGRTHTLRCTLHQAVQSLHLATVGPPDYLHEWLSAAASIRSLIDQHCTATERLVESKLSWLLGRSLPPQTPVVIANSMPVRDVEWFWPLNAQQHQMIFSRGTNGIDGTLSTALGACYGRQGVLITGDLACLHDTNGFLVRHHWQGHLTVIVINNNGGGIFGLLPIAQAEPALFDTFFTTPQSVNFAHLCAAYGIEHQPIKSWEQLVQSLNPLPQSGIRVLELLTDRSIDLHWRQTLWQRMRQ